jgi:uncharacterized protein YkwD
MKGSTMTRRKNRKAHVRCLSLQMLEPRYVLDSESLFCVPYVANTTTQTFSAASSQAVRSGALESVIATEPPTAALAAATTNLAEGEVLSATGRSPFDSSGDGLVTPLDALLVLIHLSRVNRGEAVNDAVAIRMYDTNSDSELNPNDALIVLTELSNYNRVHGGTMNVPVASWGNNPTMINGTLTLENLSLRLELADNVDVVFGVLRSGAVNTTPVNLSSLIVNGSIELNHSQVVTMFAPQSGNDLSFSFWTDLPQHAVRTFIDVTWQRPADSGVLLIENAENGITNITDQTHASYSLIQDSVVSQGSHAFHLAHPTATSNWFAINQPLSIRSDTKLFFMSQLNWATPTQIAKVQLSTDQGATWPITVFSQAGVAENPAGEGGFVFRQVDLSAYAGQNVRIRFFYEFAGGSRYPQVSADTGWVIDDIRVASEYETTEYSIGQPTALEQWLLEITNRARADGIVEANRLAADTSFANVYSQFGINPANIVSQYTASVANGYIDRHAQPLAFNATLLQAARLHSQDLLTNAFQGHTSSNNPPAPFQPGFTPTQRASSLGYRGGVAENVFSYSSSVPFAHAGFAVDWGDETPGDPAYNPAFAGQGMQNPAGHRRNIHDDDFNEAGFAVLVGTNGLVGPQVVTQKFSDSRGPMITGVVYADQDNNDFYTPGEGRSDIRVEVQGAAFHAITSTSGGYAIPVSGNGTYLVTFSGVGIESWSTQVIVTNQSNAKVDFVLTA